MSAKKENSEFIDFYCVIDSCDAASSTGGTENDSRNKYSIDTGESATNAGRDDCKSNRFSGISELGEIRKC